MIEYIADKGAISSRSTLIHISYAHGFSMKKSQSSFFLLFRCSIVLWGLIHLGFARFSTTLKCWQCAVTRGYPSVCPDDAVLYELTGWDACMTWKLANGTTILQNFVQRADDCTPKRLGYWEDYIKHVWQAKGVAECCYNDECNSEGKATATHFTTSTPSPTDQPTDLDNALPTVDCLTCKQIAHAVCDTTGEFSTGGGGVQRSVNNNQTFLGRRPLFPVALDRSRETSASASASGGRPNGLVKSLISNSVRIDFNLMVAKMASDEEGEGEEAGEEFGVCRCLDGFLPVTLDDSVLRACHDPIVRTSVVGGRCLIGSHCDHLNNTACLEDADLQAGTGIASYMSCQCVDGFRQSGEEECVPSSSSGSAPVQQLVDQGLAGCANDSDCSEIENSKCESGSLGSSNGTCLCKAGFVPIHDVNSSLLIQCRDPIVLTSTVNGLCFHQDHCRFLPGTDCKAVEDGDNLTTCQCRQGFKADREDPLTGLITRCVTWLSSTVITSTPANPMGEEWTLEELNGDEEAFLTLDPADISALIDDPSFGIRGPHSCAKQVTSVERNEWVPATRFEMNKDEDTRTRILVLFAKIPVTATDTDGILIRLMDSLKLGDRMYSIRIQKNREIIISRSYLDSHGEETENMQTSNSSATVRWLNNKEYTGFWIIYNAGYISVGVMDESTVEFPVLSWSDPSPFSSSIDTVGLTALGSAVFYRYHCSFSSAFPDGVCSVDEDCVHLANTECKPRTLGNATEATFKSCQCSPGFQTIPRVRRTFIGGCYDPIVRTSTLHGLCLDQIHCNDLPNTACEVNPFQDNERQCVCVQGSEPLERDPQTGLIPGCAEPDQSLQESTVENCKKRFEIGQGGSWIPYTLLQADYDHTNLLYRVRFFLRFHSENTIASVKLIEKSSNPRKFYKVTISSSGTIAIFENLRRNPQLFGSRNEERLKISKTFGTRGLIQKKFCGFWITYQPNLGRLSVGQTAERFPLLQWTDTSTTRLQDAQQVGFEVDSGSTMEVGAVCS